jgi:hypothetical protein
LGIAAADDDGSSAALEGPGQLAGAIPELNAVYLQAGLQFTFDQADFQTVRSTMLNRDLTIPSGKQSDFVITGIVSVFYRDANGHVHCQTTRPGQIPIDEDVTLAVSAGQLRLVPTAESSPHAFFGNAQEWPMAVFRASNGRIHLVHHDGTSWQHENLTPLPSISVVAAGTPTSSALNHRTEPHVVFRE